MSDKIIQLNEDLIKHDLKDLVRNSVEETLNALLDKEADELVNAEKYEYVRQLESEPRPEYSITNQQHFYQNNGIDGFSSNRGIIGGCLFVYKIKIYTVFNPSQKIIFWNHRIYVKDYHLDLSALFSHHKK